MVGRADDHCVDVLAIEQLAVIRVRVAWGASFPLQKLVFLVDDLFGSIASRWLNIADCDNLSIAQPTERFEVAGGLLADPDEAEGYSLARRQNRWLGSAEKMRRTQHRRCKPKSRGPFDEITTG